MIVLFTLLTLGAMLGASISLMKWKVQICLWPVATCWQDSIAIYVFMCSVHNTRNNAILLTPKYPETMVLGMCDSFDYQLLVCCCHKDTPCIVQKVCSGIIICVLYFEYRIIPSCILHSIMHGSPLPSILEVHNCKYFHQKNVLMLL